ncbi:MAG: hypothetical protein HWQ41_30495 [Nostoc sp. NOS(2021)]|uniref:hypothetical protein n=1 Tax=Nostoc sp. NOS(2021) TaxID=2815407 RepID=UPI0025E29B70|nr:hypothetical protein [Nostoc sp. NOS(2021)]MBN3899441.1 hypothetical protein [Nostoc sp. NOS(2021)]
MLYSKFPLSKAIEDFQLTIIEGDRKILLELHPIDTGDRLSYNGNPFSGDRIATGWSNYIMLYRI